MSAPAETFIPVARALTERLMVRRGGFSVPGRPNGTVPMFTFNPG